MQILLNDDDKRLLEQVDTSKFGWGNDPILQKSERFQKLRQFEEGFGDDVDADNTNKS